MTESETCFGQSLAVHGTMLPRLPKWHIASKSILKKSYPTHEKIDTKKVDVVHVKARLWISTLLQMMVKSTPERCDVNGIAIKNLWLTTKRNIDGEHSR